MGGGPKVVLNIDVQNHNFVSSTRSTKTTCGQGRAFYNMQTVTVNNLEHIDVYEAFNKDLGFYTISEIGLYTITLGTWIAFVIITILQLQKVPVLISTNPPMPTFNGSPMEHSFKLNQSTHRTIQLLISK